MVGATCWRRSIRAPSRSRWAQAQGTQMQNLAQLENARRDLQRYQALYKQDSIAKQQVDTQAALVRQYEGTVKSDQANVDNKLQLDYSRITAPISGRLGLRQVEGNLVSSSDTNGLVVITQTQPISVVFTLPETQLPEVRAELAGHTLTVEAMTGPIPAASPPASWKRWTIRSTSPPARSSSRRASTMPTTRCFRTSSSMPATRPRAGRHRDSHRGGAGARLALSSSWSRTTIRWPCGRSSWAPSTTAVATTAARRPGRDRGHRPPARGAKVDVGIGHDTQVDRQVAGRGAPAGTGPRISGRRREPVAPVHPAARGHHAVDGGHPDRRLHRLPAAAGVGPCRITRPSR